MVKLPRRNDKFMVVIEGDTLENDEILNDYEIVSSEDSEELDTDNNVY